VKIKKFVAKGFKRFTELTIDDLPDTAKLIVLVGPNGCGKSSVFDGFRQGYGNLTRAFRLWEANYHSKVLEVDDEDDEPPAPPTGQNDAIQLEFHGELPNDAEERKKLFCFRTAYRNEPSFNVSQIGRQGKAVDNVRINRMIDNDAVVNTNYQRLVVGSLHGLFSGENDEKRVSDLRDELLGKIAASLGRVFDDLELTGFGNPVEDGDFFFNKGVSKNFRYMNLSGGEKAAFDLMLDFVVKSDEYDDTVFCIDEPDLHIHTKLQGTLLQELYDLTPENCQLWVSTHSIGMMRRARDLLRENPGQVVLLDFTGINFDEPSTIRPSTPSRQFWKHTLQVALDDMANLVAPSKILICEGNAAGQGRAEFDAQCFRNALGDYFPDAEFVVGGSGDEVASDRHGLAAVLGTVIEGAEIERVVDRDDRTPEQIAELETAGVRVLSRRSLESYLLDDEVLIKFCEVNGMPERIDEVLQIKQNAIAASVERNNPIDDLKRASGDTYNGIRQALNLLQAGNNADAFMRDILAPLIEPGMQTYDDLVADLGL
jgi:hypothetical protein